MTDGKEYGGAGGGVPRRRVLQGGLAAAAVGMGPGEAAAQGPAPALKTAGGRSVDIHAHFWPQAYIDIVKAEGSRFNAAADVTDKGFSIESPLGSNVADASIVDLKQRIARMDQQGVAAQVLSLTAPMVYWADADLNHRLAMAFNDSASAAHESYPGRIKFVATLPMLDPDRAVDELNRAASLPGMCGVGMGTNINDKDLDDPMFEPVYARIEALGLPVVLHPIKTLASPRLKSFYLGNILGNPYDTGIAVCHLIFGGVMDRHPKLQVSLPHSGGTVPFLIGRMDHGWKVRAENQRLEHAPSSYLRRFTYDTICHSGKLLKFLISEVGADRIMLGSDYCYDMGYEQPVKFVEEAGLSEKDRGLILGGNAARLFKL
jgi:aminocarboxymuconate-semialdehyde decarboxylase